MNPGADRGEKPLEDMAARMKLQLGGVVVVCGPGRANDGQIVDAIADMRKPVADFDAALSALPIADLHGEQLQLDLVLAGHKLNHVLLGVRGIKNSLCVVSRRSSFLHIC